MKKNSLIFVTIIVVFAKLIAFVRELVLSYYWGMTDVTDAFNIAYTIPITIVGFVATALNASYIPIYHKAESENGVTAANKFSNAVLYVVFLISAVSFILIEFFAGPIVSIFASGFDETTSETAASLTRIMAISVFLITYNNLISAFVQLKNRYYTVIYGNIIFYILSIGGIVVASVWSITWMALGVVIGYLLESILLTIYAIRENFIFIKLKSLHDPYLKEFILLVLPILLGIFASDINMIVDKTLASRFENGSVTALSYAHKIDEAVISIFVTSIVQLAYPRLSKAVFNNDKNTVSEQIQNDSIFLSFIIIPIFLFICIFGQEITDLLFLRGAFTKDDSEIVYWALLFYTIGMVPSAIRKYVVRIFYSYGDSKTPAFNSIIVIGVNIVLSIVLSIALGLNGIVIGSSIAIIFGATRLIIKARKLVTINLREIFPPIIKILFFSIIAIFIAKITFTSTEYIFSEKLSTIVSVIVFVLAYLSMVKLFHMGHLFSYIKK